MKTNQQRGSIRRWLALCVHRLLIAAGAAFTMGMVMASAQASERLSLDLRASQVVEERGLMYCWYSNPEKTVNEMLVVTWGPGKECPIGILAMP